MDASKRASLARGLLNASVMPQNWMLLYAIRERGGIGTSAVMEAGAKCGCNHSLAVICGIFAGIAAALFLAGDRCLDAGGRLSDTAWTCEAASGAINSLWSLITPGIVAVAVVVGIPVYFAVSLLGRRWLFRYGKRHG